MLPSNVRVLGLATSKGIGKGRRVVAHAVPRGVRQPCGACRVRVCVRGLHGVRGASSNQSPTREVCAMHFVEVRRLIPQAVVAVEAQHLCPAELATRGLWVVPRANFRREYRFIHRGCTNGIRPTPCVRTCGTLSACVRRAPSWAHSRGPFTRLTRVPASPPRRPPIRTPLKPSK